MTTTWATRYRLLDASALAVARELTAPAGVAAMFESRWRELVERAVGAPTAEDAALGAIISRADATPPTLAGLVLYGVVAGAVGTGAIRGVLVAPELRRRGIAEELVRGALRKLFEDGARLVVAELPDEPGLAGVRRVLERCGFEEEARVADLVADGVALVILRVERDREEG